MLEAFLPLLNALGTHEYPVLSSSLVHMDVAWLAVKEEGRPRGVNADVVVKSVSRNAKLMTDFIVFVVEVIISDKFMILVKRLLRCY